MNDLAMTSQAGASAGNGEWAGWAPANGESETPLITQYVRVLLRWKWVILGSVLAAFLLGLIATLMMTPLYTATSSIEISRETDRIVKSEGVERESNSADMEFYQTQYGLLKARSLAERVARDLKLVDDRKFFETFGVDVGQGGGLLVGNSTRPLGAAGRDQRLRQAANILLGRIAVTPVRSSRLANVSFTSPDPELSAKVANAWGRNFIQSNLERKFDANSYARKYLETRLGQLRTKLDESERLLVGYAQSAQIITVNSPIGGNGSEGTSTERSLVSDDLAAINAELAVATGDRVKAESQVRGGGGARVAVLENNAIATLRQRRAEVAAEYAKMMVQFEPGYPAAQALRSQMDQLDRSIAREESRVGDSIQSNLRDAQAREASLKAKVEALKGNLLDEKRRSIQYNIYQRDVDTNRQQYDALLQRYKEIGVAGGVGTNNVSVVDPAMVPDGPSSPRLFMNLLFAILAGLGLGAALAFGLEQIDEAIADPGEVERELKLPLLGVVPKTADENPIEALKDRKSGLVEAYLSVQTNLEFATAHGAPRSFSVTSTRPAEGKSTTSYALAHSLARSKRKVVLIDGDMRSPSVHGLFGKRNERGLSNFLTGSDNISELLQATDQENLVVMAAGPQPPNAAELLTGPRLEELLSALLKSYDNVVIDSPPVMGLADAPLIASKVEGTIYAVESRGNKASLIKLAINRLASANAHLLGIVLTKFEAKQAGYGSYGYGYDYGYGYGQGKKESRKGTT
jgi:succinoglycan biosynthesis transport protein ExoP